MSRSDKQRLADIVDAATELSAITGRGRDVFLADAILRRAAERLLEIIGEAANTLSEETTGQFPEIAWRDITRLRIVLAHHYQRVDPEQVWAIASTDVVALAERIVRGPED